MTETPTAPLYPPRRARSCPFDPPPEIARQAATARLSRVRLWNGSTAWLVTRHADQVALLRDPRISADSRHPGFPYVSPAGAVTRRENRTFISMDEPEHLDQRRRFTADFSVRRTRELRPAIERLVARLLDDMAEAGPPADLVRAFALPLPSLVICELLGVPYADHAFFQRLSSVLVDTTSGAEAAVAASRELGEYLGDLVEAKLARPGDDLLSHLARDYLATGRSTRRECVNQARLLLVAGHETTANMIALGTCLLLRHPEQLAVVREGTPEQVENAVEELLRYLNVVHLGRRRVATADIEIAGEVIRAGEAVILPGETANRDPGVFPEPDRLDLGRRARRHLAFGSGPHQCLGQNLARLELQLAYPALLRRFPGLRLERPLEEMRFREDMVIYGVHELPVAW
ncbi:cytochrome P450 [Streptomyces hoynatensis]|uniref:Cytochrome P450 n=1 Tax=Streptomyces hoynatensis TaxID=1141874 RepID=A0A3A9Z9I5_9ACTN|nr:cytochrome P450 [Streptomyces hoynatensis]RKN43967.1 cytochrome P450 [Streptomyces hoynatensis]